MREVTDSFLPSNRHLYDWQRLSGCAGINRHVGCVQGRLAYSVRKSLTRAKARAL